MSIKLCRSIKLCVRLLNFKRHSDRSRKWKFWHGILGFKVFNNRNQELRDGTLQSREINKREL